MLFRKHKNKNEKNQKRECLQNSDCKKRRIGAAAIASRAVSDGKNAVIWFPVTAARMKTAHLSENRKKHYDQICLSEYIKNILFKNQCNNPIAKINQRKPQGKNEAKDNPVKNKIFVIKH